MQKKKLIQLVITMTLALVASSAWSCNPQSSVPLAQVGYQVQVYAHAAIKTGNAFNVNRNDLLNNAAYRRLLDRLDNASEVGERLFKTIDDNPVITPDNKLALLGQADRYAALLDSIIADQLFPSLPLTLRESIRVGRSVAAAVSVAIASIQAAADTGTVRVKLNEANAQAKKAAQSGERGTSELAQRLGQITAETTADLLAGKGASVEALRSARTAKREQIRSYAQAERTRLNQ